MTIWTQLLPGVRDARLPLAAGLIWALVGALALRYVPEPIKQGDLANSIRAVASAVPEPVLVGVGLFGAYLLGVVLTQLGQVVLKLLSGLTNLAPIVAGGLIVFGLLAVIFRLLLVAVAAMAVLAWRESKKPGATSYVDLISTDFTRLCVWCLRFWSDRWRELQVAWDPSRDQIALMVREESARTLATSQSVRSGLIDRIPRGMLWDAVRATNLQDTEFQRVLTRSASPVKAVPLAQAVRRIKRQPEIEASIRAALEEKIATHSEARHGLMRAVVNSSRLLADVRGRVDRAHVQLRAQYEGIYNEYDRLRSEGEFRTGIALPLTALISVMTYSLVDELGVSNEKSMVFYGIALVTGLAMLIAGDSKKAEAASLLYSSVLQRLVSPSDTRVYGIEFFPIKNAGFEIDLEIFRPLTVRLGRIRRRLDRLGPVRWVRRRLTR